MRPPLALLLLALPLAAEVPIPPDHRTPAELNGFTATESLSDVRSFCERLAKTSPFLAVSTFGRSGMGRGIPLVVVSKEKAFTPEAAANAGKPVVLILNSIHGGEVDGTDASLLLLRDLALGNLPRILDGVTLLVVPVYNVDGHERVSPYNRPNQNGPVKGMGFRTNARGLDLNRDFLKADAPETRALLALANAWSPDLFVDDHVTDGADFQPALTLSYADEPTTPKPIADFLLAAVPAATKAIAPLGVASIPYVEFADTLDPPAGIEPGPAQPRYATGYFALRGAGTVLVEMHAIKPYAERVRANGLFLRAFLEEAARRAPALKKARVEARRLAAEAKPGTPVVLDGVTDRSRPERIELPTFGWETPVSPVTDRPVVRYDEKRPMTIPVPWFPHVKPSVTVPRPAGYLLLPGWPDVAERLAAHGIRTVPIAAVGALKVGTYRAKDPVFAKAPYQGRTRVSATIARGTEVRAFPEGTLWVPLDDDRAPVVMAMLEPEGSDSLFAWGELSTALEQKEYIDLRVLDPLAERLLKDPKVAAEWQERLKDPAFAKSPRERIRFFYEKTPYWDETLGLLPVFRLDAPPPMEALSPAGGASAASPG